MMAHPGWRGNGLANAPWWRDAIFVRVAPGTTLKAVTGQLDGMVSIGADALILPPLSGEGQDLSAIDTPLGTMDDLDGLLREASARRMHVVVSLPFARLHASGAAMNVVRFWLTHGLAGVDLDRIDDAGNASDDLRALRSLTDRFLGQRILMARQQTPALERNDPVSLRIASAVTEPAAPLKNRTPTAIEIAAPATSAEQQISTVPLLLSSGPVVLPSALVSGDAPTPWLSQVLALRRGNAALRKGNVTELKTDLPGVSVWLARPSSPSISQPAVLVLSNASAAPVTLHLQAQVTAMHVRGVFLRALLRNDGGMGSLNLDRITLPPNGVFVGEVRY